MENKIINIFFYTYKIINRLYSSIYLLKIKKFRSIDGFLKDNEAIALYKYAKKLAKNAIVIEIGSWKGKSTYCIAKGMKSGTIYAIDPFDASGDEFSHKEYDKKRGVGSLLEQFKKNLFDIDKRISIIPCIGLSDKFYKIAEAADFIFIDGDHSITWCMHDFNNYSHILKINGYLALHDYRPLQQNLGPTYVVDNYIIGNSKWGDLKIYDNLIIVRKNDN